MRPHLALFFAAMLCGCSSSTVPTAKFFFGEPVSHWLAEATNADPKHRLKAIEVLGNVGPADPGAIPAMTKALSDKDLKIRTAAVLGLAKIGPDAQSALPRLQEMAASEKDATLRKHIQTAITKIQGQA